MDKPLGGTELMFNWLTSNLPENILEQVQIVCRPQDLDENKHRVLWIQDMPADMPFITDAKIRSSFSKIVFVSAWQQMVFNLNAGVPFSESVVIKNAIEPIPNTAKDDNGKIRLVYHPTPHRGLEILVEVFDELCSEFNNLHLDVFSNFNIYARPEANQPFEQLYEQCRNHPNISYHGSQPHDIVRNAVAQAHIFAYPCIWRETSCMSAMEAMSAKCLIVAPHYGALSETLADFQISYSWTEDRKEHARRFKNKLREAIFTIGSGPYLQQHLDMQKTYIDSLYNKENRLNQWIGFLTELTGPSTVRSIGNISFNNIG